MSFQSVHSSTCLLFLNNFFELYFEIFFSIPLFGVSSKRPIRSLRPLFASPPFEFFFLSISSFGSSFLIPSFIPVYLHMGCFKYIFDFCDDFNVFFLFLRFSNLNIISPLTCRIFLVLLVQDRISSYF